MIIDCHGHYTTEPKDLHRFRKEQIAAIKEKKPLPTKASLKISDDEIRESLEGAQLKLQRERGTDLTIFSPRASGMGHHIGNQEREHGMVADLQRPHPSRLQALSGEFRRRLPVAAVAGRSAEEQRPRTRALRQRVRLHRLQSQSRPFGRLLQRAAAQRQVVVSVLREAGRTRRAGDDPRQRLLQSGAAHHRHLLHQRRHHGVHAAHDVRPVQGFPDAAT